MPLQTPPVKSATVVLACPRVVVSARTATSRSTDRTLYIDGFHPFLQCLNCRCQGENRSDLRASEPRRGPKIVPMALLIPFPPVAAPAPSQPAPPSPPASGKDTPPAPDPSRASGRTERCNQPRPHRPAPFPRPTTPPCGRAKMAEFGSKSATSNAPSADAGNERETYDAR